MSKSFYLSEQFQEERNEKVFIKIYTHNCCMDHFRVFFLYVCLGFFGHGKYIYQVNTPKLYI